MLAPRQEELLEKFISQSDITEDILKKSGVTRLKEKKEIDQQLNKVENRIRLLKMEYHKKQKKIHETKHRIHHRDEVRKQVQVYKKMQNEQKQLAEDALRELQNKTAFIKEQSEQDMLNIKYQIERMKREEYEEVKKISLKNDELIQKSKIEKRETNVKKKQKVQEEEMQIMRNIQEFKKKQQMYLHREKDQDKLEILSLKQQTELKLVQLEQQELRWLGKLQQSYETEQKVKLKEQTLLLQSTYQTHRSPEPRQINTWKKIETNKFDKRSSSNQSENRSFV